MRNLFVKGRRIENQDLFPELLKIRERKCECCGLKEWLGKPIPLEIHHISGDRLDSTLENLQLLCPNCHSQTESWRGKKKSLRVKDEIIIREVPNSSNIRELLIKVGLSPDGGNYTRIKKLIIKHNLHFKEEEKYLIQIDPSTLKIIKKFKYDKGYIFNQDYFKDFLYNSVLDASKNKTLYKSYYWKIYNPEVENINIKYLKENYPLIEDNKIPTKKRIKKRYYCLDCGKEISEGALRCKECNNKRFKKQIPSKEELLSKLKELKFLSKVSSYYNISTMLLEDWCKKLNIEYHKRKYMESESVAAY